MRYCLSILTWALLLHTSFAQPEYRFQHFDTSDGLASDLSISIVQDSLGFLWVDYGGGKTRYDGYNFKIYNRDPEDPSRMPRIPESGDMILDNSGNLWILPMNPAKYYELARYDRKTDGFDLCKVRLSGTPRVNRLRFEKDDKSAWIGTSNGLSTFEVDPSMVNESTNYTIELPDSVAKAKSNHIFDLKIFDYYIMLATENGIWNFDKDKKMFSRPPCNPTDSAWLYQTTFFDIFDHRKGESGEMWLVDNYAFSRVKTNLSLIQRLEIPGGRSGVGVMGYDQDKDGVFWMGTWYNGLCRMNPADSSFQFIKNIPGDPNSLGADLVREVMIDRNENVWLTTSRGISRLRRHHITFHNLPIPMGKIDISMVYHANGKDYVLIDNSNGEHHIMMAPVIPQHLDSLDFKQVLPTLRGAQGNGFWKGRKNFWITMWGVGVISVPIDTNTGMILRGPITTLGHDPENENTISSPFTTSPWEDNNGNLWVGSINGLNKVVPGIPYGDKGSVIRYHHIEEDPASIIDDHVLGFYPEDERSFWVFTLGGVDLYSDDRFNHRFINSREPKAIHRSQNGIVSIGTSWGLYEGRKHNGKYVFEKTALLKNADIVAIHEDGLGRLWISTKQGIVFYDRKDSIAIEFSESDGFLHRRMAHGGLRPNLTSQGVMVISDFHGLTLFDPSALTINRSQSHPVLVKLAVNNQPVASSLIHSKQSEFSISKDISVLDELVLDYRHNNFTFEFSAMDLTAPEKNLYRHKLEGYDKEWVETDAKARTATYTNLDAGKYVFKVKASNYHGIWSNNEKSLTVIVLPPPWETWWAYTLYGFLILAVILYLRHYDIKRVRLKQRAQYLGEMDHLKARFFANISHEFRTPVTLILGPLRDLYAHAVKEDQRTLFAIMIRNGERLLRLINQLLDLSKIEAGKMQLRASLVEIVSFIREHASAYEPVAADKKIKYEFHPQMEKINIYIDKDKMEKVIHNILSNALKFTSHGEVIITLTTRDNTWVELSVADTGRGISADEIDKVFDRFYQVDSSQTRAYEGSGLGMALAKELVELHHGHISVESIPDKGSTFKVCLPLLKSAFKKEEIVNQSYTSSATTDYAIQPFGYPLTIEENGHDQPVSSSGQQPLLLVVEDNADMRDYIRRTLLENYNILEAVNGQEGVRKAQEVLPDLIISDVMMPAMDGYQFCEKIKNSELTCHIPVIMLTAKADRESKLSGLQTGADDYLSKPFDADELKLIIRNRIEERRKMRERFSRDLILEPRQIAVKSMDEQFLKKVLNIVESHMDDEGFSVTAWSQEVGYSHIQFYRKIKALCGQTPNYFLRTIRLKRAAELLRHNSDYVAQIAFSVGFSSESYFIKCFKDQYGITPRRFAEQNRHIETFREKDHPPSR